MPAYNQGAYINDAIDSLKKQTFQNFKVLIVDDVSTDNVTTDILKKIKYNKAEIYFNKENKGVGNLVREFLRKLDTEFVFIFLRR